MKPLNLLSLGFACSMACLSPIAVAETPAPSKFSWNVVKVGEQEFVPLSDIAAFYKLPDKFKVVEKRINLDNGVYQVEVGIDSREAYLNGVRQWLAFPMIQNGDQYLISRLDLAKTIEPALRPQLIPGFAPFKTVVIDAGHGGVDKGAASPWGLEKNYTLDTARRLRDALKERGYKVVMTRDSDIFIPLEQRAAMASKYKGAIFVSIHYNATGTNPDANGIEVFSMTPRGAPSMADAKLETRHFANNPGNKYDHTSFPLACAIQYSILGNTPQFDRGVKRARFAVLRRTTLPSVLVECGFLSNTSEARRIADPAWRNKIALAIAEGIDNYKGLVTTKKPPKLLAEYRRSLPTSVTLRDATDPQPQPAASPDTSVQPAANPAPAPDQPKSEGEKPSPSH